MIISEDRRHASNVFDVLLGLTLPSLEVCMCVCAVHAWFFIVVER